MFQFSCISCLEDNILSRFVEPSKSLLLEGNDDEVVGDVMGLLMSFIEAMMMPTLILSQHGCSSLVMVHAHPLMKIPASIYLTIIFVLVDDQT